MTIPATFEGATVVVTGASRGLGAAIAQAFGAQHARVWVGYRAREKEALSTAEAIERAGGEARTLALDVRNKKDVERAFDVVLGESSRIDVLINNAGISRDALFGTIDEEGFRDVVETNLLGTAWCCRAALPGMWRARRGAIVNVASVSGPMASPGQASYAASKAGIVALTRTLGAELAPRGIRVNAVVPGLIDSGMTKLLDRRIIEQKAPRIPLGRLGGAEEVAACVLFLASDAASYIVGQALFVDGGLAL